MYILLLHKAQFNATFQAMCRFSTWFFMKLSHNFLVYVSISHIVPVKLQLASTMRLLARLGIMSRAAHHHALSDSPVTGRMPLHVMLPCHNSCLREVSLSYIVLTIVRPLGRNVYRVEPLRISTHCKHISWDQWEWDKWEVKDARGIYTYIYIYAIFL